MNPDTWNVVAGINTTKQFTDHTQIRAVRSIILHSDFDEDTYDNDICLFKIKTPFTFTNYIQPVCLPHTTHPILQKLTDESKTDCFVSGYGYTAFEGTKSGSLMSVKIPVVERSLCNSWLDESTNGQAVDWVLESQRCAGFEAGGIDACQGDSGGPLSCVDQEAEEKVWHLTGVVSWGIGCAERKKPGVYTKIENYYNWVWEKIHATM